MGFCSRCDTPLDPGEVCNCRKTPTVRPGSSNAMRAVSPSELRATTQLKIHALEKMRERGDEVPAELMVYGQHFVRVFGEWEQGELPGAEAQRRELQRYLEWLPKVERLTKA